jgi:hypothetical protein
MNHQQALTNALMLALTAPKHRLEDALELVNELSQLCTPKEIAEAQEYALNVYPRLEESSDD